MNTCGKAAANLEPCFATPYHILKNTSGATHFRRKLCVLKKFSCCNTKIADFSDFFEN